MNINEKHVFEKNDQPVIAPAKLENYRSKIGQIFTFIVTGADRGSIWGTDVYTDDSYLGITAVHAGLLNVGQIKSIRVQILPGQTTYKGTFRNGINSLPYGHWFGSYSFPDNFQSAINILYKFDKPSPFGPMCGSTDDNDYLLVFYMTPFPSLVLLKDNQCQSTIAVTFKVSDICWSQPTQTFIFTSTHIHEFNPANSTISEAYGSDKIPWTIACDVNDLFIVHYPDLSLRKRDVHKPFSIKQEWTRADIMCEQGDQLIGSIRIHQGKQMGITIKQMDNRWRVDFFQTNNMQRLYKGEPFGSFEPSNKCYCKILIFCFV